MNGPASPRRGPSPVRPVRAPARALAVLAVGRAALGGPPAAAGVWVEPGDRRLREDVERLKAHGLIRGPVDSWPLPLRTIDDALETAPAPAPPSVRRAADRLERHSDLDRRDRRTKAHGRQTSEPALVLDFGSPARNAADLELRFDLALGAAAVLTTGAFDVRGHRPRGAHQRARQWPFPAAAPDGRRV